MTGAIVTSPFDVVKVSCHALRLVSSLLSYHWLQTRLQSDLFRDSSPSRASSSRHTLAPAGAVSSSAGSVRSAATTAASAAASARPTGARGLLYNFVETGYIIRCDPCSSVPPLATNERSAPSNIYTQEGPRALFKGLGPTLIGVVPARAINFSTYAQSKVVLARWFPDAARPPDLRAAGGGGAAGATGAEASPVIHLGAAAIAGGCGEGERRKGNTDAADDTQGS